MSKPFRILIVDDESEVRDVLKEQIQELPGYEADFACDGSEALHKFSHQEYGAVLSDVKMPNMDGVTFLRKLRKSGSDVPFVFLSGHTDKEIAREALRLGAFDLIDKPWRADELKQALESARHVAQFMDDWSHPLKDFETQPESVVQTILSSQNSRVKSRHLIKD